MVARQVSPEDFGAFSLAFATYTLALGASRALNSEPLTVRYADRAHTHWQQATSWATGGVLVVAIAIGGACIFVGSITSGATGQALIALGGVLPGLLLQDAWRYAFFANGRGNSAFLNDVVWAVALVPALAIVFLTDARSIGWLIIIWGGGATIAAATGVVQSGAVPDPRRALSWWRQERELAPRFFVEFAARNGAMQAAVYCTAAIAGLAEAGALRAGQILLGPLNVLFMGLNLVAVPEAVRLVQSPRRLLQMTRFLSLSLACASLVWGLILLAVPRSLGQSLLGESWDGARTVLLPLSIGLAAIGAGSGGEIGLRALLLARKSLRVRVIVASLALAGAAIGAALGGGAGAAWGLTAALLSSAVMWWRSLSLALHRPFDQMRNEELDMESTRAAGGVGHEAI